MACMVIGRAILLLSSLVVVIARHPRDVMTTTMTSSTNVLSSIDKIYQFGDSVSDTGNLKIIRGACSTFPYGESYFHYATGRCSDGLLMVDHYAMAFGLPFLNPYLEKGANFSNGVDFAVGASTALSAEFLATIHVANSQTNDSLSVQLDWFREHLKFVCSSEIECKNKLKTSLVLMEEIGGNDYALVLTNYELPFQVAYELVPHVIKVITDTIKDMIDMGVVNVLVPGVFPFGCMPSYLVTINSTNPNLYDELGCLIEYNNVAEFHNLQLQKAIQEVQLLFPNATIVYGDYFSVITSLLQNASSLGFEEEDGALLRVCCGNGNNPYNFNSSDFCGTIGVPVCPNPKNRVMWDGYHFTQQFYKYMADWMLTHTIIPMLSHTSYISI